MESAAPVSVIIPTKNRRELLRRVIHSVQRQSVPCEILVMDDGSNDGTAEAVRREFAGVAVHREERSRGPAYQRNKAAALCGGEFLLTLDDDCELVSPETVGQTLAAFTDPRIAAVTVPFINILKSPAVHSRAPSADGIWVTFEYYGGMVMFRRAAYRAVGGYRESLFIQVEEGDLSIRLLAAGLVVRLGAAAPLYHHESPVRQHGMRDRLGPRNSVLFCWHNVPMPHLLPHLGATVINNLVQGARGRRLGSVLWGLGRGLADCVALWGDRRPVNRRTYTLSRRLRACGAMRLEELEGAGAGWPGATTSGAG